MARNRWVVVGGIALGLAVLAPTFRAGLGGGPGGGPAATAAADQAGAPSAYPKAPGFTVTDPEGKSIRLSDLKGKVVVLSFWATWCPPCRMEMPHLSALSKKYRGRPVEVLGVNLDQQGKALRDWVKERDLAFRVAADTNGRAAEAYRVEGIPSLFVIDQNGCIREHNEGFDPSMEKNLSRLVDGLLKKK